MVSDSYLCGIFDGEGSISITHRDHLDDVRFATFVQVKVEMKGQLIPMLFHHRFGGGLYNYPHRVSHWAWHLGGRSARACLEVLSEGCLLKNDLANTALEMLDLINVTNNVQGKRAFGSRVVTEDNLVARRAVAARVAVLQLEQYTRA